MEPHTPRTTQVQEEPHTPRTTQTQEEFSRRTTPVKRRTTEGSAAPVRISKEEMSVLLAMWARDKPDCAERREKAKGHFNHDDDKVLLPVITGAVLLDTDKKIRAVTGSGYTHAASYLCTQYPALCKRGTICLSAVPCTFCLKLMIQADVARILVPDWGGKQGAEYIEPEPKQPENKKKKKKKKNDEEEEDKEDVQEAEVTLESLLLPTRTALSYVQLTEKAEGYWRHMTEAFPNDNKVTCPERQFDWWAIGLAILASSRVEDKNAAVGAVLVRKNNVIGVGYNGFKTGASPEDFPVESEQKGSYVLHAEQNALMFREGRDPVDEHCRLYNTHSPCFQCSMILLEGEIGRVVYAFKYRHPCKFREIAGEDKGLELNEITHSEDGRYPLRMMKIICPQFSKDLEKNNEEPSSSSSISPTYQQEESTKSAARQLFSK